MPETDLAPPPGPSRSHVIVFVKTAAAATSLESFNATDAILQETQTAAVFGRRYGKHICHVIYGSRVGH
jgi:hypothetical protein